MNVTDVLAEALACIGRGWAVFPSHSPRDGACTCRKGSACSHTGKHPRTRNGFHDATTDRQKVLRWWKHWPDANLAIATGAMSGLVVIDVDPRHGGDETLAALESEHGAMPATVESLTGGGGRHLLFQHPGGTVKCKVHALGPGVDMKGDGGYVIAPPSLHVSGQRYTWRTGFGPEAVEIASLPDWPLARLQRTDTRGAGVTGNPRHPRDSRNTRPSSNEFCEVFGDSLDIDQVIRMTVRQNPGERNQHGIFDFVRTLMADPKWRDAPLAELKPIVRRWHEYAEPYMSGRDGFTVTWADFVTARQAAHTPKGIAMAEVAREAEAIPVPQCAEQFDNDAARRLVCLCKALQGRAGENSFYLDCRTAARVLGINHGMASQFLLMLCGEDILKCTYKGHTGRASEYRYLGD